MPLPTLNWQPLRATKNTIFEKLDDEHVHEELNFGEFEELFKTNTRSHEIQVHSKHFSQMQRFSILTFWTCVCITIYVCRRVWTESFR